MKPPPKILARLKFMGVAFLLDNHHQVFQLLQPVEIIDLNKDDSILIQPKPPTKTTHFVVCIDKDGFNLQRATNGNKAKCFGIVTMKMKDYLNR